MSTIDADDRHVQPFAAVLQQIAKGAAHTRLSEALADLVRAVCDTDKKGSLTLTLTVEPTKGMDTLTVAANCTVKLPQEQQASLFFADETGNLSRNDPRQTAAPLAAVGTARAGETA